MDSDQLPRLSHCLLQLPPDFESFHSKRHIFVRHGTHTSTFQTCDYTRMSTEMSHQNTESPLTPTPTIVNGTSLTHATTMVVVPEAPIITATHSIVNAQPICWPLVMEGSEEQGRKGEKQTSWKTQ
jgi:hypothetical protein